MSEKRTKKTITLGSGKMYITEFTGKIPENSVIETEEKIAGYIQGGASLEYSPEFYTAEDDLGKAMTWNGKTLQQLCATGRVTEEKGIRKVKIGGISNNDNKNYVIHFVHEDKVDGDVRVTIVGKNTAGFTLAFAKDKETVVDAEFGAVPSDDEGTLIIYQEEIDETL